MKKQNIKKLKLNKKAVSSLDNTKGGAAAGSNIPLLCPVGPVKITDSCPTDCFLATCWWTCAQTCFPC
jgi:hypothetical protein